MPTDFVSGAFIKGQQERGFRFFLCCPAMSGFGGTLEVWELGPPEVSFTRLWGIWCCLSAGDLGSLHMERASQWGSAGFLSAWGEFFYIVSKASILWGRAWEPSACCLAPYARASAAPSVTSAPAVGQGINQGLPWSKGREHRPSSRRGCITVPRKGGCLGSKIQRCSHLWKMASSSTFPAKAQVSREHLRKSLSFSVIRNASPYPKDGRFCFETLQSFPLFYLSIPGPVHTILIITVSVDVSQVMYPLCGRFSKMSLFFFTLHASICILVLFGVELHPPPNKSCNIFIGIAWNLHTYLGRIYIFTY